MRNDANDELDHIPSLSADERRRDDFAASRDSDYPPHGASRHAPLAAPARSGSGALWALVGAMAIALGGVSWWSFQQISLMEQQLVATQESFARISEEAAGRIQDISGKVVATESNVTSGSEELKLRVRQLENKLAELTKQQQGASSQQGSQDKRLEQLVVDLKGQQDAAVQVDAKFDALTKQLAEQQAALAGVDKLDGQIKNLAGDIAALKKQGNANDAVKSLEQDLLILRSEVENRPAGGQDTAEFDAFRLQVTRNISALQAQVQNLQQQINAR
ncbi:ATPase [Pseudomonas sp. LRF_L74]|uniref:ATPase n=1 Tax=Pseudomonas sp. LRF_L74 TaxID=3369422 RepID=UPI003F621329